MKRQSIKKQLFTLFVPFIFGLWIISAILSFWLVSMFSRESFDKDLINSTDSVVGRLRVKDGKVVADLPPAAQAILKHAESDKLYYRVLGEDGSRISGDNGLPDPSPDLPPDRPRVVSAQIAGKDVRIAEVKVFVDDPPHQPVIIQVAETTNVRKAFQEKVLLSIAVPQFLIIVVGLSAVFYGIARLLTPLRLLQKQLSNRSQADFSPLEDNGTPEEVYPLVKAINQHFERSEEEMRAHQRFISNAAHQLRTPLAGLKTYTSIGTEMSDMQEMKGVMTELDVGVDRASRMVSQLLALARTDRGAPSVASAKSFVDLNFLVSDIVAELVEQAVKAGVELTFEAADVAAIVYGDQSNLRHMIVNLVENAILYTSAMGRVKARLKNEGDKIILTVCDNGRGIPENEREKVFERFYRIIGTNGNGSGLGLSIVKEVADAHAATVKIEVGPEGKGTTVLLEFQAARK